MNKIVSIVLILFFFNSCKEKNEIKSEKPKEKTEIKNDSISISLEMPAKTASNLNVWIKPYDEFSLDFKNESEKDSTITMKIPLLYDHYQMDFVTLNNNKIFQKYFIASQHYPDFKFKFESKLIGFKQENLQSKLTNSIYESYENLRGKYFKTKKSGIYLNKLDSLNTHFKKLASNQIINSRINEMHYLNEIQKSNPSDKRVEKFLKDSKTIMSGGIQLDLLFFYFKNNATLLDYENLTTKNHSETYIELLAIGAYRFLKLEDNKGDIRYSNTVRWLKTTDFYKRDSIEIKKKITPLDSTIFKENIRKIELIDLNNKKLKITEIISKNNSQYYLIDFWATWCAPCIRGVKEINTMTIPKNIKILSFSVDKEKDIEKWRLKTNELKQELTYRFDEKIDNNKAFTDLIEMKSIPRYLLIDKNLNLIDQAFFHPHDPQFLSKLNNIDNHKYW